MRKEICRGLTKVYDFESIQLLHLFSFDRKETTIYSIDTSLKSHDARTQTSKAAEKGHCREKERNQYGKREKRIRKIK
jgi:hypothetical protein